MRWFVMGVAFWSVCGWSQVGAPGMDAARVQQLQLLGGVTEHKRLRVEVVLAYVLDVDRLGRQGFGGGNGAAAGGSGVESLVTVHRALGLLGAPLLRYNLLVSDHVEVLFCQSATVYFDQRCWHGEWDRPVEMEDWFADLHSRPGPQHHDGTVVMYAVHL